uniref:Uncharacterized protein n=2 Tax=Meloidogyne TaxID=189290 RepID=A0A6V7W0V9_MELEN|nr:unnamed protein product [Meloidogyne enterolobii]
MAHSRAPTGLPRPPLVGENMAAYLTRELSNSVEISWEGKEIRSRAENMLAFFWEDLKLRDMPMPAARPLLSRPAYLALVKPQVSVAQHFQDEGKPLAYPKLPCLVCFGGIRGTSRKSKQNARRVGHDCWLSGEQHRDFIPLEKVLYQPEKVEKPSKVSKPQPPPKPSSGKEDLEEIRILARGLRGITITLLLVALFSPASAEFTAPKVVAYPSAPYLSFVIIYSCQPRLSILTFFNFSNDNKMPKRPALIQEQKDLKKARERHYIDKIGKPMSLEDQEKMEEWVEDLLQEEVPECEPVLDLLEEEQQGKPTEKSASPLIDVGGNSPQQKQQEKMFSILSLPPPTQQQEKLENQQIKVLETTSQLQGSSAAAAVKLANKEELLRQRERRKEEERTLRRKAEEKAEKRREEEREENRALFKAILDCLGSKSPAVPAPVKVVPAPPASVQVPSHRVQDGRVSKPEVGAQLKDWRSATRNRPFVPREDTRRSAGSRIPQSAAGVEQHLRTVHSLAQQLEEEIKAAREKIDFNRLGNLNPEFVQETLAVDGAIQLLARTIRTSFIHLNIA